jgi:outer membrane protein OmpA-like peptidoglycan-associated protein
MATTEPLSMRKIILIVYCGLALTLTGCASTEKAELTSGADTQAAVAEVVKLASEADKIQAELLSFKEHRRGTEHLQKAQRGLAGAYKPEYILENAAIAKASFQQALKQSKDRSINALRILQSRKAALGAGLKNSAQLTASLADVDDDLRDETDNFSAALEPKEFSEFQKKYFSLEVEAVQFRELDAVKKAIQKSSSQDAEDLAPNTLRTALLDDSEAENLIAQSPRDAGIHGASVTKAVESSVLLSEVMDVILNAPGTPENIALKIVRQNRELAKLSENVGSLEQNLKSKEGELKVQTEALQSTRSNLQESESALMMQNEELEKNSTRIRFQIAMDAAVKQFSEDEASVYQQGSKLIFRLKRINFRSGTSTIPAASKPLLAKIDTIIQALGAELVVVQGHTDSIGAADLNKQLSTKRAVAVSNYLASLAGGYKIGYIGFGESRPIVTNETKEGRAINRRVDLVVTAKKRP